MTLETIGIGKGDLKWHLLAWCLYVLYACSIVIPYPEIYIIDIILANIVSIISFYSCIPFIINFGIGKYLKGFTILVISILLFFLLRALLYYAFTDLLYRKDVPSVISKQFWAEGMYIYIHFLLNAVGYYFLKRSADRQREIREVTEEKIKIQTVNIDLKTKILAEESMRHVAEANFLRAQINPHFLQNTLNFLYAQSLTGNTEKLSEGILLLSEMMRYSLQNQGDSNARVPLQDEVKHLENYIAINQLRFGGKLQIVMEKKAEQQNLKIIPLVLLTLLENAFKHGELQDELHPLQIRVEADKANTIRFEVFNKINEGPKEKSTGIGIENTRRRLETAYPGHYRLETAGAGGFYKTTLRIELAPLLVV